MADNFSSRSKDEYGLFSTTAKRKALDEQLLTQAILRLNGNILGIVLGIVTASIIFIATNWLIIKGGPDVGRHLRLLSEFYIGYSVSFFGSLIGMVYGFITGYLTGYLIAWLYNRIVLLRTAQ